MISILLFISVILFHFIYLFILQLMNRKPLKQLMVTVIQNPLALLKMKIQSIFYLYLNLFHLLKNVICKNFYFISQINK